MKLNITVVIFLTALLSCTKKENTLFTSLSSDLTNVHFNNLITESDSMNILDYEYIYNGGGVALADFNNDGLDEIFFTGNMVSNALYHNKGNLKFDDISKSCKIYKEGIWSTGVSIVDINQDGLKDIYVTVSTHKDAERRKNLLYINETKGNAISFSEQAEKYGLADTSYTMNSAFFDYDNDGDLDLFIINNRMDKNDISKYRRAVNDIASGKVDKLFRNDFNDSLGHAFFTDVSQQAGIIYEGYSLGLNICDINNDGWKDIYITNDFLSNDLLYINNQDGTFNNKLKEYLNHTCYSAMGNDVVDINNDALPDIIALDMLPNDNFRKKTMLGANNYSNLINNNAYNFTHQLVRNVVQLNRGMPDGKQIVFSDIANLAGVQATDWSWAPLVADFDADGKRDLIITNGFPKDITDKDFMDYQSEYGPYKEKKEILSKIPQVKLKNFAYRNNGDLTFEDVTESWGINEATFSNGAAYGDLDNDGDLDYVVNNINDKANIYQNNLHNHGKSKSIKITLIGDKPNIDALGATINYKTKTISSTYMHQPGRGYLSFMSQTIHIGLGNDSLSDIEVIWPDQSFSYYKNVKAGSNLLIRKNKSKDSPYKRSENKAEFLFSDAPSIPTDTMRDIEYIDYNFDPLLIKKLSDLGPGIAVSDINSDGQDDYYIPGPRNQKGKFYIQSNGKFKMRINETIDEEKEELAPLFFDADNDGDEDLYIGCGSNEFNRNDDKLKDVLMINEQGQFKDVSEFLPVPNTNTACVKACDYDKDGDIDLFIGGKSITHQYPLPEVSFLLRNDTKNKQIKFTKIDSPLNALKVITSDALWSDVDSDGWVDLIIIGDYSEIIIYRNIKSGFERMKNTGLEGIYGMWNSINGSDIDNDGDIDYVVGNYGQNSLIKASEAFPFTIYSKDFDNNSAYDFIPTTFWKNQAGETIETPYHVKGDLIKELIAFRKKFVSYSKYANSSIDSIIIPKYKKDAYIVHANYLNTATIINEGKGKFKLQSLPVEAQFSTTYGTLIEDFNSDGNVDILLVGNNFGHELTSGRMDANFGTVLLGDGRGNFKNHINTGISLRKDSRSVASIQLGNQASYVITSNNNNVVGYQGKTLPGIIRYKNNVRLLKFYDKNGKLQQIKETYIGNGYLSQSSRSFMPPFHCKKVELILYDGSKQTIDIP